uniref:Lymphoid-restricted membrane protein n=1 Tax=Hippocampus comes TaxID=109280 RepID=A0A3Q2XCT4_HIPCM
RHNPVDSICRKLLTNQWRGDREPNSPFQIPKLSSSSYDSPQCGLRRKMEAIMRKGIHGSKEKSDGILNSAPSHKSNFPSFTPSTPAGKTSSNTTYTITSTLGESKGVDRSAIKPFRTWQKYCSTPTGQDKDSPYFTVTRDGPHSAQPESESKNMAEVSLICEENLLDTIFHACDTQRRKVYVSHIVDFLRHTTSRTSEDKGLEELCNMLDPERKDVSIDLDTYHAVMREWIDDCRNNRRSMLLNMTSGSLEGFGGDASRAEETSELVYCLADVQMNNQKLQEEVRKLKQAVEGMEESNQKLADENEELRNQTRHQQLIHKEKMLHNEVEEMKATLSCTEEGRARASARSKHVERENQDLIAKIALLQDENFKVSMEMDELQKRIAELCDINADLQVQIHSFDTVITEKESLIQELLRADKSKLESHMQVMSTGVSLSAAYRLNQSASGSLQTELALAQSPLEGFDHLPTNVCFASPLDETLDREVLLMMHGPSPDIMALEFQKLLNKLAVQVALDATREDWALSLDQLAQYTDSIEKELVKMASNVRRSRTEILHLSVVQDQENQKRQLSEELEQLKTSQDSREASCQTTVLSTISDHYDSSKEDKHSLSANDKEIESEFQRLALGFKCDMFTLEKRLRLEERSRDLAEENVRREVSSCQGLLQALTPLCEDDTQSMEIIHRLQKNLDILIQSMSRVSSRSEMLGAIHQESRIGKAVEVMIQHVENLRRVYTKEHAELLELRETLMQNERSFGSHSDREFRGKKPSTSQYYKSSARRVSIAAIPRSGGGNMHYDMQQDGAESEAERLTRRSPNMARPPLKRFVSSAAWVDTEEPSVVMKLLALLASLVMQPAVDAAPVGTGDSWMTIQQLLWPYTGLRHNGQ